MKSNLTQVLKEVKKVEFLHTIDLEIENRIEDDDYNDIMIKKRCFHDVDIKKIIEICDKHNRKFFINEYGLIIF